MTSLINKKLSMHSKIELYKFLYTLNAMDFSYLRPVILAALFAMIVYIRRLLPESFLLTVSKTQVILYHVVLVFLFAAFLYYLWPIVKHKYIRLKIWLYRRKKRACTTFFFL